MVRWYVTDMDRTNVKVVNSYKDAKNEAVLWAGLTTPKRDFSGFYEYHNEGRTLYIIREDRLKMAGFEDIKDWKEPEEEDEWEGDD